VLSKKHLPTWARRVEQQLPPR